MADNVNEILASDPDKHILEEQLKDLSLKTTDLEVHVANLKNSLSLYKTMKTKLKECLDIEMQEKLNLKFIISDLKQQIAKQNVKVRAPHSLPHRQRLAQIY